MVTCVLLCAGLSQRFGSPKAVTGIQGTSLLKLQQRKLISSSVSETVIVLGAHYDAIQHHILKHKKIRFVYNKDYILGQTSSFQCGVREACADVQGFMLLPVDYPVVKKETINLLTYIFLKERPLFLIPRYQGRKGHPPLLNASLREKILELDNSLGINTLMSRHETRTRFVDVDDPGVVMTFNTQEEFSRIKSYLET